MARRKSERNIVAVEAGRRGASARLWTAVAAGLAGWACAYSLLGPLADFLTVGVLGISPKSALGSSLGMFVYQVPKVLMLLVLVVFAAGVVRSFFTPEMARRALAGKGEFAGSVLAAMLGTVTPFCTCAAVPLFIGFVETGVPLGVTFSFLIAAPMVNEIAVALLLDLFGWKVAALYVGTGLAVAVSAGWVISRLKMERFIEAWVFEIRMSRADEAGAAPAWEDRVRYGLDAVRATIRRIWPYLVVGIATGAIIHGYVPDGFTASFMGKRVWWSVPAAVAVGVPMYSNAAGIIPVLQALMEKGAALGTVLAFMMAVIGLSLPEVIILRRVLKTQLIAVFLGVVATGIFLVGFLFNAVLRG